MTVTSTDIPHLLAVAERVTLTASLILDVVDGYASAADPSATRARPRGALRYCLVESAPGTKDAHPLQPPLPLATITNPSGYELWFGQRADGGPPPDPGSYTLRIDSEFHAPYIAPVQVPTSDAATRCTLQPGYAYPFAGGGLSAPTAAPTLLRGTLQSFDGTGQAGATVALTAGAYTAQYLTDASGQFVLVIPDPVPATVSLAITDAGGAKTSLPNLAVSAGTTTVVPQTVLAGRVVSTVVGGTVQLSSPSVAVNVAPDGTWRVVLPPDQRPGTVAVSATVPGQRKKTQSKIKVTPGQVVTVPPFVFIP
jgi:hypothetical protein